MSFLVIIASIIQALAIFAFSAPWQQDNYELYKDINLEINVFPVILIVLQIVIIVFAFITAFSHFYLKSAKVKASFALIGLVFSGVAAMLGFIAPNGMHTDGLTSGQVFYAVLHSVAALIFAYLFVYESVKSDKAKSKKPNSINEVVINSDEANKIALLKEYKSLLDDKVITQEEFEAKKKEILG